MSEQRQKRGTAAAHGVGIGRAYLVDRRRIKTPKRELESEDIEEEILRFRAALQASDRQLEKIKQRIEAREASEHYNIIAAHQLILHDEHLVDEAIRYIREEGINAEWALHKTVEHIKGVFDAVKDEYFRERRSDVDFVGERVLRNLLGQQPKPVRPPPDAIVVAHDLSPADTAQLHRAAVAGLITDAGGKTSHTAIIARAHGIPAVVGLEDITAIVETGDLLIVDGTNGAVIVNPEPGTVVAYRDKRRREEAAGAALLSNRDLATETTDGVVVELHANIDLAEEIPAAVHHGALGIGLFRTEFLFMTADVLPDEEAHCRVATEVLSSMEGRPTTFRTFDLGADKLAKIVGHPPEHNPALGLRSIRLCLTDAVRPLFKAQLRGLLRASVHGRLQIMFPMISGLGELRSARAVLDEAMDELSDEGVPFDSDIPVGIMVEMPSAAVVAQHLAPEVDFFSVGTNDLIQYTLAVDRVNEHVSYLYEPLHPSLLQLIHIVVAAGRAADIPVAVCGEMAGDPIVAPVLVGLGLRQLSMNAVSIPEVKSVIRKCEHGALAKMVERVLTLPTVADIREYVLGELAEFGVEETQ